MFDLLAVRLRSYFFCFLKEIFSHLQTEFVQFFCFYIVDLHHFQCIVWCVLKVCILGF